MDVMPERVWKRDFFAVWTGQAFSLIGSQLVQFALVWWLTIQTGSAIVLAVGTIVATVPMILFAPFAGVYVDRWNRRTVMIVADALIAFFTLLLMVSFALGAEDIWQIYAIMFFRSVFSSFHWPAMQATTSLMVPERHLARIGGLNQALGGMAGIIAPPMAAVLIAFLPMQMVLSIDLVTAFLAILPLVFVPIPQPIREKKENPAVLDEIKEGFKFIQLWKGAAALLFMFMAANFLLSPAFSLAPLLVTQHFQAGALEYATLESLAGVGILLGGLCLGIWGGFKKKIVTILVATVLIGVGTASLGLLGSDQLDMAFVFIFIVGFFLSIVNGSIMAMMQTHIPNIMQGRVLSLLSSGSAAMSPLGLAIGGPVAEVFGIQVWYLIAGIPTALMGVAFFLYPAVMNMEENVIHPTVVEEV